MFCCRCFCNWMVFLRDRVVNILLNRTSNMRVRCFGQSLLSHGTCSAWLQRTEVKKASGITRRKLEAPQTLLAQQDRSLRWKLNHTSRNHNEITLHRLSLLNTPRSCSLSVYISPPFVPPFLRRRWMIFSWLSWLAVLLMGAYARRRRRRRRCAQDGCHSPVNR